MRLPSGRRGRPRRDDQQAAIRTQCGVRNCRRIFPNPTLAATHVSGHRPLVASAPKPVSPEHGKSAQNGPLPENGAEAVSQDPRWHVWDTDAICNAQRWVSGMNLKDRRACRAEEHQDRECWPRYEGEAWIKQGPAFLPHA